MPELSTPGGEPVRPGAMTAVMRATTARPSGPRWLRWAVVRDGRVEREEVSAPERAVTLGVGGDVPGEGATRELLAYERGAWILRATPGLRGRTDAGPLETLSADGTRDVTLGSSARGRLELPGGASLLIQLVDRPPAKVKPRLPAGLVGGLFSGADWWFTSFVAASFCLHLGVVAYLLEADWPIDTGLVPDRYAEVIFPELDDPPVDARDMDEGEDGEPSDEVAESEAEETEETDAPPSTDRPTVARREPSGPRSAPTIDPDAIGREVAEQLLIAGLAPGSASSAFDALRDGASLESAASVFDVVEGTVVAENDVGVFRDHDGASATDAAVRDLGDLDRRPGVRARPEGRPIEEVVVRRPEGVPPPIFGTPEPDDPEFDVAELVRRLRARMPAVRSCYEHVLSHGDPDASGRITLSMQVMPPGHLAAVRAVDNTTGSDALGACVVRAVQTVRVNVGPTDPVTVEFPVVLARQE